MADISIVTAFFDIGRSDWTLERGFPHYLYRPTDTYLERFGYMAELDNEMTIFTSKEFEKKVKAYRKGKEDKTNVIVIDYADEFKELRMAIAGIQTSTEYQQKINPQQRINPEYWSADYVLVNLLKTHFVNRAINLKCTSNDLVAWVDFGYCRNKEMIKGTKWEYDFDPTKIHMFKLKDYDNNGTILDIISNNDVHMTGGALIAGKDMWPIFDKLIQHSFNELYNHNLIDDDQTYLLMSYLLKPYFFELYQLTHGSEWLQHNSVFNKYNV